MNSPIPPEVADVKESLLELEAAVHDYTLTAHEVELEETTEDQLSFALARVVEAGRVLRQARAALAARTREFARLDSVVGAEFELDELRARLEGLGFGGDEFGLG